MLDLSAFSSLQVVEANARALQQGRLVVLMPVQIGGGGRGSSGGGAGTDGAEGKGRKPRARKGEGKGRRGAAGDGDGEWQRLCPASLRATVVCSTALCLCSMLMHV